MGLLNLLKGKALGLAGAAVSSYFKGAMPINAKYPLQQGFWSEVFSAILGYVLNLVGKIDDETIEEIIDWVYDNFKLEAVKTMTAIEFEEASKALVIAAIKVRACLVK